MLHQKKLGRTSEEHNIFHKKKCFYFTLEYNLPISFFNNSSQMSAKGQLILKWFFGVIDFLQKTNERIRLYYYDTSGRLVFVRFLEESDDPKKPFRN